MFQKNVAPFAVVACFSCAALGPEQASIQVSAGRSAYLRDTTGSASISLTIANTSNAPVYLEGCPALPGYRLEREAGGSWRAVSQPNVRCLAIYSPVRLTLSPGEVYRTDEGVGAVGLVRFAVFYGRDGADPWSHVATSAAIEVR